MQKQLLLTDSISRFRRTFQRCDIAIAGRLLIALARRDNYLYAVGYSTSGIALLLLSVSRSPNRQPPSTPTSVSASPCFHQTPPFQQ